MNANLDLFGYGFGRPPAEEDLRQVEAVLPLKRPGCPMLADLIDLAQDKLPRSQSLALREHVRGCRSCQVRFEFQQRRARRRAARNVAGAAWLGFAALAAAVLIAITPPDQSIKPSSRVELVELLPPAWVKAGLVVSRSPARGGRPVAYEVTVTNIPFTLKFQVPTSRSRGLAYQIGRRITLLGSFDRTDNKVIPGSCVVHFDEQPGRDLFLMVLIDKGETSHLAESLGSFLSDEDHEKLVEAAGWPGIEATAREVIVAALKKAGLGDSPVEVVVVATVEHAGS
jgi:hypothetical protein